MIRACDQRDQSAAMALDQSFQFQFKKRHAQLREGRFTEACQIIN